MALLRRSPWKSTEGLPGSSSVFLGGSPSLGLKLFRLAAASISAPSTVKCSSDSRPRRFRFQHHFVEQSLAHPMLQQPLPVLSEDAGIETGLHEVHAQKPAEEEIVIQLLAESPFTAHRVQGNQ